MHLPERSRWCCKWIYNGLSFVIVGSGLVNVLQNVTAVVSLSAYEVEKWSRCRLRVSVAEEGRRGPALAQLWGLSPSVRTSVCPGLQDLVQLCLVRACQGGEDGHLGQHLLASHTGWTINMARRRKDLRPKLTRVEVLLGSLTAWGGEGLVSHAPGPWINLLLKNDWGSFIRKKIQVFTTNQIKQRHKKWNYS